MSLYRYAAGDVVLYTGAQGAADMAAAMKDYIETVDEPIYNEKLIQELKEYNPYKEKKETNKLEFLDNLT